MNSSDSQTICLKQLYMNMCLLMHTQSALLRMEPGIITEKKRATYATYSRNTEKPANFGGTGET